MLRILEALPEVYCVLGLKLMVIISPICDRREIPTMVLFCINLYEYHEVIHMKTIYSQVLIYIVINSAAAIQGSCV